MILDFYQIQDSNCGSVHEKRDGGFKTRQVEAWGMTGIIVSGAGAAICFDSLSAQDGRALARARVSCTCRALRLRLER
jgi:hypothetical protein